MTRWDQARQIFGLAPRQGGPKGSPTRATKAHVTPSGTRRRRTDAEATDASEKPGVIRARGPRRAPARASLARSLCIASGKGGTGKSSIAASLAALFARRGTTLLMDADLGCANAHILQDVHPERSFADVIEGDFGINDIVTPCKNGVDLLAGGSGIAKLAGLKSFELEMIGRGLQQLESNYDHLVIDAGAGLSRQTVAFAVVCDATIVVTTPDVTAMTDAYAFIKVFVRQCEAQGIERPMPLLVVNRTTDSREAEQVARRLQEVVFKFLGRRIEFLAGLPEDRAVFRAAQRRSTVVDGEPESEMARALHSLSTSILSRLARGAVGKGRSLGAGARLAKGYATE